MTAADKPSAGATGFRGWVPLAGRRGSGAGPAQHQPWRAASALLAMLLVSAPAAAVDFSALFSLKGQSLWAPGPAVNVEVNDRLGPPAFSFGKTYDATVDPCPVINCTTGARAGADTNGEFALRYGAKLNSGSYDLLYPVYAKVAEPLPYSNAVGSAFTLATSYKVAGYGAPGYQEFLNGQRMVARLTTHSPTVQAFVDLDARFHAFVGAQYCLGGVCAGPALGPVDGNASQTLLSLNRNNDGRVQIGGQVANLNQYVSAIDGNLTARLKLPNIDAVSNPSSSQATQLLGVGRDNLLVLDANVGNMVSKAVGLPLAGNAAGIGYNLLSINAGLALDLAQTIRISLKPIETFSFLSPVQMMLAGGLWSAPTKQITVPLGTDLVLKSNVRSVAVLPATSLEVTVSNLTELVLQGDVNVLALAANIYGLDIGPLYDSGQVNAGTLKLALYQDSFSFAMGAVSGLPFNILQSLPDSVSADPGFRALFSAGPADEQGLASGQIRTQDLACALVLACPYTFYAATDPSMQNQLGERVFMADGSALTLASNDPGELGSDASQRALLAAVGYRDERVALVSPIGLPSPVPEPGTSALMLLGVLALAARPALRLRQRAARRKLGA